MSEFITSLSYWLLVVVWASILYLYIVAYRKSRTIDPTVGFLIIILMIDAFRTVFESAYFGLFFNSLYGFLPHYIYDTLSQPQYVIVPKLVNVFAGLLVLFLIVKRWLPEEVLVRAKYIKDIQESKGQAKKEQLRAERELSKFEAVFDGMSDAIVVTDMERTITAVNRGMQNVFGYNLDDLKGKKTSVLYDSVEEFERQGRIRFNLDAEEKKKPCEVLYRRKNGEVFVGETLGTVIKSPSGAPYGFLGVIRDISERKADEEAIQRHVETEEVLIQEIHHRVKNNLQVISSMLHLQKSASPEAATQQALSESQRRVDVLAQLYAHIYESRDISELGMSSYLKTVVDNAKYSSDPSGEKTDVSISFASEDIVLNIKMAMTLAQIASELISNCYKHAFPEKKGEIMVTLETAGTDHILFQVKDDGIGLPDDFNPQRTKTLGFQLVTSLVKQLRGMLEVTGEHGTTVKVQFSRMGEGDD